MSPYNKLELMQKAYGTKEKQRCKDCCNYCVSDKDTRTCYCSAYGKKRVDSMDWYGNGIACGLFNRPRNNHEDGSAKPLEEHMEQLKL